MSSFLAADVFQRGVKCLFLFRKMPYKREFVILYEKKTLFSTKMTS